VTNVCECTKGRCDNRVKDRRSGVVATANWGPGDESHPQRSYFYIIHRLACPEKEVSPSLKG
jgi:hypothetical protein